MNRRDLLKYFAAGTIIAPVSGAAPLAKLIETPKIDVFDAADLIITPVNLRDVHHVIVTLEMMDGTSRQIAVKDLAVWGSDTGIVGYGETVHVAVTLSRPNNRSPRALYDIGKLSGLGKIK